MSILLAIFLFFLVIIIVVFSMLRGLASLLFGALFGRRSNASNRRREGEHHYEQSENKHSKGRKGGKVFAPDEGEYVKFEEIE